MRLIDSFRKQARTSERATVVSSTWNINQPEALGANFADWATKGYAGNAIVFAVLNARLNLFTEARFKFRNLEDKRLYGTQALAVLEEPWTNGSTGDLLARAEQDVFIAGNFFAHRSGRTIERLRPDWVEIVRVVDESSGLADVVGYVYRREGMVEEFLPADQVAHWYPIPDPLNDFRGMGVLTPIIRDVNNDLAMTQHKTTFFENAATPNLVIKYQRKLQTETLNRLREAFDARFAGATGQKTMLLDEGGDVSVVGNTFEQMAFTALQAAGEARIAAAASVPPQVVGLQVGIEAGGYANYREAFKAFGSGFMRSHWRSFCAAMAKLVQVPAGYELWFDVSDIAALQEAETERAEATATRANAISSFITAGFEPASVVAAVNADDLSLLEHTGALSVQLYPNGNAPGQGAGESASARQLTAAEVAQKVYLAVGKVLTVPEAREIVRAAGADLPELDTSAIADDYALLNPSASGKDPE